MTRRELEECVAELAAQHEGTRFVEAIQLLAINLSDEERDLLGEVLVERSREQGAERYGELTERMRAARWRVILPPPRPRQK